LRRIAPRVVDEHVQGAQARDRLVDHALRVGLLGVVAGNRDRALADQRDRLGQRLVAPPGDGDEGSLLRESKSDGASDPAPPAGHENDPVL
jgi:hypothetical protein